MKTTVTIIIAITSVIPYVIVITVDVLLGLKSYIRKIN